MSLWGRIFAVGYDAVMSGPEKAVLRGHRAALLARANESVLEIGGGTGANLPYYGPRVSELVLTEPERPMAKRLEGKLTHHSVPATVLDAPAEKLPFEDARFDFVISTLVLCTVIDPPRALTEIRRVLKPTGQLLFIEHVRSDEPALAKSEGRSRSTVRCSSSHSRRRASTPATTSTPVRQSRPLGRRD